MSMTQPQSDEVYIAQLERAALKWKAERDAAEADAIEWEQVARRIADESEALIKQLRADLSINLLGVIR